MENIFSILNSQLPKSQQQEEVQAQPVRERSLADTDTKDIIQSWQKDNDPAKTEELLKRMHPVITSAMNSYAPGMDDKLAVKAAHLTLDALRSYDPKHGTDPKTHVFNGLKRLSRLSGKVSNIIPQPEGVVLERKRVQAVIDRFNDDKGREPSMAELADLTGISRKRLDRILSGDTVVNESATLSEDSRRDTFAVSDLDDKDYFEYVYASVGPIDQKIMEWSSGLHGKPLLSNNAIASKLHISPAAVSQHKNRIQQLMSDVRAYA